MGPIVDKVDGGATTGRRPPVHQMRYSRRARCPGVSVRTTPGEPPWVSRRVLI